MPGPVAAAHLPKTEHRKTHAHARAVTWQGPVLPSNRPRCTRGHMKPNERPKFGQDLDPHHEASGTYRTVTYY